MRCQKTWILAGLFCWALFAAAGCGDDDGLPKANAGKSSDADGDVDDAGVDVDDASGDTGSDAGAVENTGTVEGVVYRQGEVDHSGVMVTLDGTDQDAVSHATGFYQIKNVDPGTYTVTASAMGYAEVTSSPFEVKAGETTTVDPITIEIATGELAGTVLLEGQDDHSGAVITVEGTSYTATTDENGNWSITGVSVGQYRIEATHSRYEPEVTTDISVLAGQVTTAPSMTLVCLSGYIVDGVCCNGACNGACESCRLASSFGTCTGFDSGADPDLECASILTGIGCESMCDGNGGSGEGACLVRGCEGLLPYHPTGTARYNPFTDNDDGTVSDKITGLMWTRCAIGESGDNCETGSAEFYDWQGAIDYCEKLDFAGRADWRLPDRFELQSIVDYWKCDFAINRTAFPGEWDEAHFWSSSSVASVLDLAWLVGFDQGSVNHGRYKTEAGNVRCVRLGPLVFGTYNPWAFSGDRVVENSATGLMWQGCAAGQSGSECSEGAARLYDWPSAIAYCEGLSWAGFDDWRLPGVSELSTIVDVTQSTPAINMAAFPSTPSLEFWSSSSSASNDRAAWYVDFDGGGVNSFEKGDGTRSVRCVRLGT